MCLLCPLHRCLDPGSAPSSFAFLDRPTSVINFAVNLPCGRKTGKTGKQGNKLDPKKIKSKTSPVGRVAVSDHNLGLLVFWRSTAGLPGSASPKRNQGSSEVRDRRQGPGAAA